MQLCSSRIYSKGYHIMDILLSSIECKCKKSMIHCTLPDQHHTACCHSCESFAVQELEETKTELIGQ